MHREIETRLLLRSDTRTPLGRCTLAGFIKESAGVRGPAMRLLGSYALVYLLEGSGSYADAGGQRADVRTGDLILVFPDIGHLYGPGPGEHWSEFYLVFDGPVFDLWRTLGLLDPARPLHHLAPIDEWLVRLEQVAAAPAGDVGALCHFQQLLAAIVAPAPPIAPAAHAPAWLARARSLLEAELHQELDMAALAQELGLSTQTFRKRFQQHTGLSPARYRLARRIDAACALLQRRELTTRAIAASLHFSDEFHFSRRFKQATGLSPREFRRRLP